VARLEAPAFWPVLVHCASSDLDLPSGRLRRLLSGQPDWEELIRRLAEHGLLGAFKRLLEIEGCADLLPESVLPVVKGTCRMETMAGLVREQLTERVLRALAERSIPLMPVKGIHLSEKVYPRRGIRPLSDVDLLTTRGCIEDAALALTELGLEAQANHTPTFRSSGAFEVVFEVDALRGRTKSRFRETYLIDADEVWTASIPGELFGVGVREMRPEHLLIYLSLHLAERHYFERLIWLRDIREVIIGYGDAIDWEYLAGCAKRWRAASYTYFSLLLASRLAGAPLGQAALAPLRPRYPEARLFERLLTAGGGPQLPFAAWSVERQLLSVLGDGFLRRAWAEATFPIHAAMRMWWRSRNRLEPGRARRANAPEAGGA